MSSRTSISIVLAALLLLSACASSSSETTDTTQPAGSSNQQTTTPPSTSTTSGGGTTATKGSDGSCTVEVTGDKELTWMFNQNISSFSTDYWLSEDDLRSTVDFIGAENMEGTYDELVASGKPIITFFQVSCFNPDDPIQGALVTMTNATAATDIPMAPATYLISGGIFDADGPAGTAISEFDVSSDELYGTIGGSGSLVITRWDSTRIEGSYSFDAKESFVDDPRNVHVMVTFSFACAGFHTKCS